MSDRISLLRWRPVTDPPKEEGDYPTDAGIMFYDTGFGWQYDESGEPSVWCDPSPPGDDAPTLKDLQRAHDALLYASGNLDHGILTVVYPEECEASAARIRRAIEEADR